MHSMVNSIESLSEVNSLLLWLAYV